MLMIVLYAVFLGAIAYQGFVYSVLALKLWQYTEPASGRPADQSDNEGVSVVVCAHNERENLERLLPRLLNQRFTPYEVVIADDRSSDDTAAFLDALAIRHPSLRVVRVKECPAHVQPKKHALTRAIEAARYDQLLLTDADCQPVSTDWLRLMTGPLRHTTQFVLGYAPYRQQPGWLNRFIRYETLHTGFLYTAAAAAGHPYMGVGRNLAYRKLFFKQRGGLAEHQAIIGGDDDLWVNQHATRSNTTVVLHENALVYSDPKIRWNDYYYQKKRHLHVGQHYRLTDKVWLGLLSLSTMLVWITGGSLVLLCNKWEGIVALFLLRWLILATAFSTARRRLHDPINLTLLPILDFLHVMYYIVVGTLAFSTKTTRWTN